MGKGWAVFFGVTMFACLALFVVAPFVGWWIPEQISTHAADIDRLFYIILAITGFFFILTEALLVVFMWQYGARPGEGPHTFGHHAQEKKVFWTSFFKSIARPVSSFLHNQHRVEMAWTLVPAAILLYIAFAQVGTWADAKYNSRMPAFGPRDAVPVQADVSARQFEWRIRYPSLATWKQWQTDPQAARAWAKQRGHREEDRRRQFDDVHVVNELHVIKGRPCVAQISTLDVIHSFNLPHMRVKQDALPGRVIPAWFTPMYSNTVKSERNGKPVWEDGGGHDPQTGQPKDLRKVWEIACAELCGDRHYRMVGKVFVHDTVEDFEAWLQHAEQEQNRRSN